MRRAELVSLGIQLPVLPTIVLGGLPGGGGWASRLAAIGLDVVASGAAVDTQETFAAAVSAVPFRPVKATGPVPGALIAEPGVPSTGAAHRLMDAEILVPDLTACDPNVVAREVLQIAANDPSEWWVAAAGLAELDEATATARLEALVEGVRQVRLYLAKQQFD